MKLLTAAENMNFYELNNKIMIRGEDGFLQLEYDKLSLEKYLEYINQNSLKFDSVMDRINYLTTPQPRKIKFDINKVYERLDKMKLKIF